MANRLKWTLVSLMIAVVASGLPAAAQEDQAEDEESTSESATEEKPAMAPEQGILDEIVVTARKRTENIQEVPISISTIDTEQMGQLTSGAQDVKFLSGRVPSLVAESSFGRAFPRFYIRGLGNTDFDLNASQPVSLVYDEVVLENPIVKGMPLFDIQQVEVLRGPQGSLFGRNTPAGVVKFESAKPTRERDGFARLSYGTFDTFDFQGAVGGPISETLSARVAGMFQSRSDWVDNTFTGENDALGSFTNYAYRLQLLWEPSENFDALLNVHGWDVDGTSRIFRANIIKKGTNDLVDGFEQDKIAQDGLNKQDISAKGGVLKLDYDFGSMTLTSVTGYETLDMYSRGDIDGGFGAVFAPPYGPGFIPFYSETADGIPDLDQFTQEVRIASNPGGAVEWLGGFFYFDEDFQADTFSYTSIAPGNPQEGYAFQKQQATSWALFGTVGWWVNESWKLQGGLRYTQDEKDFSAERPQPVFQTPTSGPIKRSTDADNLSWDVSATYKATEQTNVYGRVATGFRAPSIQGRILFCADFEGGTNPATNCVSVADEEKILSGEIGVKSELLDRRLRLNLATYVYEVDGQQIVAVGGQTNTATLLNADTTNGYGFESDIEIAPNSNWFVKLGLSYNHTEIDDPNLAVGPCGGGCTVLDPIDAGGNALVDGNSLPHAPELIFNGIIDYRQPIGNGVFIGSVDWAYHDEKSFFLYESKEFVADSFELGLRFAYAMERYEVALWGRNITDEDIVQNGIDFNNLTGMTNEPRQIGVEISTRF